MKFKKLFVNVLLIFTLCICTTGCTKYKKQEAKQTEQKNLLKPITINIPEKRSDGNLIMYDTNGTEYLRFNGIIHIENDGSNGKAIKIKIYHNESEEYEFN